MIRYAVWQRSREIICRPSLNRSSHRKATHYLRSGNVAHEPGWPNSHIPIIPFLRHYLPVHGPWRTSSLPSLDYEALQAEEILNSDGRAWICLKQSCPQPLRIGHREHSLIYKQGSSKMACMPIDLAGTSTTASWFVSGQVIGLAPETSSKRELH